MVFWWVRGKIGTYKDKTYVNYQLVESVRTPKGPRQNVVCSLGDLGPRSREQRLLLVHKVESVLVGQEDLFEEVGQEVLGIVAKVRSRPSNGATGSTRSRTTAQADDLVRVRIDAIENQCDREAGSVHVAYQFWKKLGLKDILADAGLSPRETMPTCVMTLNRLLPPCSEHAMPDWIRSTALSDILAEDFNTLTEDPLYRNLDALYPKRAHIESLLAVRERNLFNLDHTVFLYDLTSTYFEGQSNKNWKAKKGYSRDKRPDCNQVVVGLVVNRDGFLLAHEVFEGNVQDQKTVGRMLDLLGARIAFKPGQTVVVDRGMAYTKNIEEIRSRNLHYLVATRQSERDQWLSDFEDLTGFEEVFRTSSPTNPHQRKSRVSVQMRRTREETHVLCQERSAWPPPMITVSV